MQMMTEEDFRRRLSLAGLTPAEEALVRKVYRLPFKSSDIPADPAKAQEAFATGMHKFQQSGRIVRR